MMLLGEVVSATLATWGIFGRVPKDGVLVVACTLWPCISIWRVGADGIIKALSKLIRNVRSYIRADTNLFPPASEID